MLRKKYVITTLLALCLATISFIGITTIGNQELTNMTSYGTTSTSEYDPWIDLNGDGAIDSTDLGILGVAWGSTGDPTRNVNITNWPVDTNGYLKVTMPPIEHPSFGTMYNVAPGGSLVEPPIYVLPPGCKSVTIGLASHGTGSGDVYVLVGFGPFYEHWFPIYDGTVPTTPTPSTPVAYSIIKTCDVISDVLCIRIYNPSAYTRSVYVGISGTT